MAVSKTTGGTTTEYASDEETHTGNVVGDGTDESFIVDANSTVTGALLTSVGNDSVLLDSGGTIDLYINAAGQAAQSNTVEIYNNTVTGITPQQTTLGQYVISGGGDDTIIIDGSGYTGTEEYAISVGESLASGTAVAGGAGNDSITITDGVILGQGIDHGLGSDTVSVGPDVMVDGNIQAGGDNLDDLITVAEGATVTGTILLNSGNDTIDLAGEIGSGLTSNQISAGAGDNDITIASSAVVDTGRINMGTGTTGSTLTIEDGAQTTLNNGGFTGGAIQAGGLDDTIYLGGTYDSDWALDINTGTGSDNVILGSDFSAINTGANSVFEIAGQGNSLTTETDTLDIGAISGRIVSHDIDPDNAENGTITLDDGSVIQYTEIEELVVCFAGGTMLETASGPVPVEELQVDDMVHTRDNGLQPIRWIGSRKLSMAGLQASPNLRPIRIQAGAIGKDIPESDLTVSPQHRVLVRSKIAQRMFSTDEVLVAAKHLLELNGIQIAEDVTEVEYFHILFDRHEVVFSNGAETESLHTGPQALKSLNAAAREEIFTLFPELREKSSEDCRPSARILISGRQGRKLAMRHNKNSRELVF
ncbi:Hint domain-containing protein [Paracoccus saliphilus]|uniref:Hint domain-containing protein n=2 Tax=Paracoccus saliphilus TaxID=405559 RepID=A0AA45W1K8_9RHOB|nr:Hint domain-containing protein [Paracoccus saliphilus]SIS57616.1 Hint domain-containing protein [Paracoccus saliphilus]